MLENKEIYFPRMLSILLVFLSILFITPDIVLYKIIKIGPLEESAGILFFPFVYSVADAITEVYGRKRAYLILAACYFFALLFSCMITLVIHLPSPPDWQYQEAFSIVFNKGPLGIFAGMLSVGTSMYVNIKLMSGLKRKIKNKHFIVRSIISSSIAELIVTVIAYPLVFYHVTNSLIYLMISAYLFKLAYSIIGAFPAKFIVLLLRHIDGIEQETYNKGLYSLAREKR